MAAFTQFVRLQNDFQKLFKINGGLNMILLKHSYRYKEQ